MCRTFRGDGGVEGEAVLVRARGVSEPGDAEAERQISDAPW